jgi:hypothetical protein
MCAMFHSRLQALFGRGFDAIRRLISRVAPGRLRQPLLQKEKAQRRRVFKFLASLSRGTLLVGGAVAIVLLLLSLIHIYRVSDEPPYVTYEHANDGTWQMRAEYRVVESPYAYWRSKTPAGIAPELRQQADQPTCRDRATIRGETLHIFSAAVHATDPTSALKELSKLEISQLAFSYFLRGGIGEALDDYHQSVATCRWLVVRLPPSAQIDGDVTAVTTVEMTESSEKSTTGCDVYSWHKITPTHSPCGWSAITEPAAVKEGTVTVVQVEFFNWLQDAGVDRCARLSVRFRPPPGWQPPGPHGSTCMPAPSN